MGEMLWKPSDESIRQSNMYRFMQFINSKYNQKFTQYAPLYAWSVRNIPDFWASRGNLRTSSIPNPTTRSWTTSPRCPGPIGFQGRI